MLKALVSAIFFCVALLDTAVLTPADAGTVLDAIDSGWYNEFGYHENNNENYIVGNTFNLITHRDFFLFDLSGVGSTIASAELRLFNHSQLTSPSNVDGYISGDATETYVLYDVDTAIASLTSGGNGLVSHYNDLGSGTTFGSYIASAADNGTAISIPLNADAVQALNNSTGSFAIGGAITTLRIDRPYREHLFSNSHNPPNSRQLVLKFVPEPTTCTLALAALCFAVGRRGGC